MPARVVLLSGPIAAGKSTLGDHLVERFNFIRVKTREVIAALKPDVALKRTSLQEAGEALDIETAGQWVLDAVEARLSNGDPTALVLVDSVRIKDQIDAIRRAYGHIVTHVHLTASIDVLAVRYKDRHGALQEAKTYKAVRADPTEASIDELRAVADVVIDTERSSPPDVFERVASRLRLYGAGVQPLVDVLIGGQYGSEGKGHIASYLAPDYQVLIRVGGPNAGHKVYDEPELDVFRHLPSGSTRAPKATLALGPGALIWLPGLRSEITTHEIEPDRLRIDPQAILIEDVDQKEEEKTLKQSIASTAQGVGRAHARKVMRKAADPPVRLARDEPALKQYIWSTRRVLDDAYATGQRVMLEGTQGTLLSIHHGFYPYVTSRDTTASGTMSDAGIPPTRIRRVIMVCRTYPIRVGGSSGPFGEPGPWDRELTWETVAGRAKAPVASLKGTEKGTVSGSQRRVAEFGWADLHRAAALNGPTDIALTFADYIDVQNEHARRFEQLTPDTIQFIEEIERVAGAPVSLISTRFRHRSIIDRRRW